MSEIIMSVINVLDWVWKMFLGFSAMIFIHELGHFMLLKYFKVRVLEFSLGFVGQIVGFRWKGTLYKIAWIPFGGYVKPEGEYPEEDDESPAPDSLVGLVWWKKTLVYLAGPTMNLVGAWLVFSLILAVGEKRPVYDPIIGVDKGSSAALAGLKNQDRILKVNGQSVENFDELANILEASAKAKTNSQNLLVERDGQRFNAVLRAGAWVAGIRPGGPAARVGLSAGDRILSVDGNAVSNETEAIQALKDYFGSKQKDQYSPVQLVIEGNEGNKTLEMSAEWDETEKRPLIGIQMSQGLGVYEFIPAVVGSAKVGYPAREAGLARGDRILRIEGESVETFLELMRALGPLGGQDVQIDVEREGKVQTVTLVPIKIRGFGHIGVVPPEPPKTRRVRINILDVPGTAATRVYTIATEMVKGVGMLISGDLPFRESLSGPLTIGRMMKQEAEGGWQDFLLLVAALNIILGVINLFPIPVVDGGEIVFCLLEGILGRRVRVKTYMFFKQSGFFLLMILMVFVMWNDISRLVREWLYPQML